jgi:3-oxoacyl-[acyl-carrier protein] reductase
MRPKLQNKVALVTGAGRGIGRAISLKLASEGARLVLNDLDPAPAQSVADEIVQAGGEAVVCAGNVCAPDFAECFVGVAMQPSPALV